MLLRFLRLVPRSTGRCKTVTVCFSTGQGKSIRHPHEQKRQSRPSLTRAVNAFVASQCCGYFRSTPENDNLKYLCQYLKNEPSDFRAIVKGFLNSPSLASGFGPE